MNRREFQGYLQGYAQSLNKEALAAGTALPGGPLGQRLQPQVEPWARKAWQTVKPAFSPIPAPLQAVHQKAWQGAKNIASDFTGAARSQLAATNMQAKQLMGVPGNKGWMQSVRDLRRPNESIWQAARRHKAEQTADIAKQTIGNLANEYKPWLYGAGAAMLAPAVMSFFNMLSQNRQAGALENLAQQRRTWGQQQVPWAIRRSY